MKPDLAGLADVVVLCVKNAMAPVLERLARVEQENAYLKASLGTVTELRDRVVIVEAKAAMPLAPASVEGFDLGPALSPVLERVAAVEARAERVAAAEHGLSELRDRLTVVETKSATAPASEALTASDVELLFRKSVEPVQSMVAEARERLIAVETRAPIPGPAGKDGIDGKAGTDGAAGRDGLGFEDLDVEFDGDRTLTLKFARGSERKVYPIVLPYQRYQGVFTEGKAYTPGDVVTWAGSTWHANKETSAKPGEGSKDWTLIVKRGRDGKDGGK